MRTFISTIVSLFCFTVSVYAEVIDFSHQIDTTPTSVNAKPFIIFSIIATAIIIFCLTIGKRYKKRSTFHGPAIGRPSCYDKSTPHSETTEESTSPAVPHTVSAAATASPKAPSKPLLRRFPGAERSDNGHSPLDTAPPPPNPSISNFLDHMLLTAEDLQVDQKDDRELPLSKSSSSQLAANTPPNSTPAEKQ